MTRPRDTSPEALDRQRTDLRRMAPGDRLALAARMSEDVRRLSEAGIRSRHPEYSPRQLEDALREILLRASSKTRTSRS